MADCSLSEYALLPFRFERLDEDRCFLSNYAGNYYILPSGYLEPLVKRETAIPAEILNDLKARQFIVDEHSGVNIELLANQYRTRLSSLPYLTSLFMVVATLRCNHDCRYCQVSHRLEKEKSYDMNERTAKAVVDFIFQSPSPAIKIEFQGGEPLLNFPLIKQIVEQAEEKNRLAGKEVEFVIATNLSVRTPEIRRFLRDHDHIFLSTSLDGPKELHNANRPYPGHDSYEDVVQGIAEFREDLGCDRISALMTTTGQSLASPKAIIDEYLRQGFNSIFLRPINPYGNAVSTNVTEEYSIQEWLEFFQIAVDYILELNYQGISFREDYCGIILRRMLTPYPTGFVDLQSPAGLGIAGMIIDHDGSVYPSDEGRMLAAVGDKTFRLGNVKRDTFKEVILSDKLVEILSATMTESVPMCSECGFQPYCGADPIRQYVTQKDLVGIKPTSEFCQKHSGIIRYLIEKLQDPRARQVFLAWAS